jgi:hypothetical protein
VKLDAGKMEGKYVESFAERTRLIAFARTSGRGVVYCLKTFFSRHGVRTQLSHSILNW